MLTCIVMSLLSLFSRIDYEPKAVGKYTVNVIFADQEIPTSPYTVIVEPNIDVSGVKVLGLEKGENLYYVPNNIHESAFFLALVLSIENDLCAPLRSTPECLR